MDDCPEEREAVSADGSDWPRQRLVGTGNPDSNKHRTILARKEKQSPMPRTIILELLNIASMRIF